MTTLDTLLVRIEADMSDLKSGLQGATRAVNDASNQMANATGKASAGFAALGKAILPFVTVAAVVGIGRVGKAALDAAGDIGEMAQAVGLSTDAFQELTFAASTAGVSQEQFSQSMAVFSRNIGQAANGNASMIKTLDDLGVKLLDSSGNMKPMEQILNEFIDALARVPDHAKLAATGNEFFGRTFAKLIPLISGGSAGLNELRRQASKLTQDQIKAADEASDKIKQMEQAWDKLAQTLASKVAPLITKSIEGWRLLLSGEAFGGGKSFAEELVAVNRELAEIDARAGSTSIAGRARAVQDQARRALLEARREELLNTRPPPGSIPTQTPAGSNPMTDAGKKLLEQLETQKRLAQVTGNTTSEIERQRVAIEVRTKAMEAGLSQADIDRAVALALATYDLAEAEKARVEAIEGGKEHFRESLDREIEANQAKQDLLDSMNDEIDDTGRLLEALKKGERAYAKEKALLDLINKAKQKKIDLSDEEIAAYEKLADQLGDLNQELEDEKERIDENKKAARDFAHVIGQSFEDAIVKGKGLREVMNGLLEDISRIILRVGVTKPLETMLTNSLGGGSGGSSGGGGFDLFGSIGSLFSSGGGGGESSGGGFLDMFGSLFSSGGGESGGFMSGIGEFFGGMFADGGTPPVGKASIVGEKGPELFIPKSSGTVVPNSKMGGSTYYIDARGADPSAISRLESTIRELNGSVERRAVTAVQDARQRNPRSWQ